MTLFSTASENLPAPATPKRSDSLGKLLKTNRKHNPKSIEIEIRVDETRPVIQMLPTPDEGTDDGNETLMEKDEVTKL